MKIKWLITSLWAAVLLTGVLTMGVGPASAQDGILLKVTAAGDSNYCHLKFPAIRPETLSWDRPVLKPASAGDVIDFYGPCSFDPTGEAAVQAQKQDEYDRRNLDSGE